MFFGKHVHVFLRGIPALF